MSIFRDVALNETIYLALKFAYNLGFIDAMNNENNFQKVIDNWFGIEGNDDDE